MRNTEAMKLGPTARQVATCFLFVLPALAVRPHGEDISGDVLESEDSLGTAVGAADVVGRPQQPPTQPRPSHVQPTGERLVEGMGGLHDAHHGISGVTNGSSAGIPGTATLGPVTANHTRTSCTCGMLRVCASSPAEGDSCQFRISAYWLAGIAVSVLGLALARAVPLLLQALKGENYSGDARRLGMKREELEARIQAATKLGAEQRCAILDRFCGSEASMLAKDEVQSGAG